ncbi:unnamed protein product [Xyrichtys novacula]|uniref:Unnamed protein product n=1 Tax=Xyrichtys novacula TaxID=13765 RepID=A0AAV1GKF7_XYRNO|nr:unnamed protein product [Xyrichtys novacula]
MSTLSFEFLCLKDDECPSTDETQDTEDETDLESDDVEEGRTEMSISEVYLQACKLVSVVPVSFFIRNINSQTMTLSHHGLGPLGCKAIAIALVSDMNINTLELADTHIEAEGAKYLVEMLRANFTIQHLDLSNNNLLSAGAEYVAKMLLDNISLKSLKLSGNGFTDDDAKYFADALSTNAKIKELDLSHNAFCGKGGEHLGLLLANNEGLELLDLSWNHLRMKGAVALSAGLKVNRTLKHLDLSWNGFGNEGALAMGEALKFNNTLVHLNLNNNRLTNEGVGMLCRGLEFNDTLRVLLLAYNSLTVEGALALVNVVKNTRKTALEEINICNVLVNETFVHLLEMTCQEHPSLDVQYGGVGGSIAKKPPKRVDPMKVIQDYLDQRKLRLWDFFRNIDKDGTMRVPTADFRKAVQQSSIPLDRYQIEELIQRLDRDRTGIVDYRGLADTRKQMMRDHRRQLRKVESRQKKEKQKSDRILKTFQSAVEAVTPRSSMVMSPGGGKEDSSGPQQFSATPLSSWHHIVMSNSSRYSVTNLSNEHIHLPMLGGATPYRPTSSPAMRSYSQPNLVDESHHSAPGKSISAQGVHSDPEMSHSKLTPTANNLTRSRPALNAKQPVVKPKTKKVKKKKMMKRVNKGSKYTTKTVNSTFPLKDLVAVEQTAGEIWHKLELEMGKIEDYESKITSYAEKIVKLTTEIEKIEKNPDDYNDTDIGDVKVEIKQVEALIKELQLSLSSSTDVFESLQVEVTEMVNTLNKLEKTYDKNLVLATRREYIKVQLQLEECERRHQELFYPNIGSCAHTGISRIGKPIVSHINAHLTTSRSFGGWGKDSKPIPDRESMYWFSSYTSPYIGDIHLYSNYKNLILRNHFQHHNLHNSYKGNGNNYIVRDNTLYYQLSSPFGLGKLNFTTMSYASRVIPGASPHFSYTNSPSQNFDFAADETGLWVTYASEASGGRMIITKIDEPSFGIVEEWTTSVYKPGVSNAFMVCGVLYVVRTVDTDTDEIFYKFDTKTKQESYVSIPFERFQDKYSNLDYNPTDQKLYMYNDGYYVSYHLWFNHTDSATVEPPLLLNTSVQ